MHQKLTKHGRFYKQNNQFPTKSHDELEDNSTMLSIVCTQLGMRGQVVIWLLFIAKHLVYNIQLWCGLGEDKKTNTIVFKESGLYSGLSICVVMEANLGTMSCRHDTYPSRHYAGCCLYPDGLEFYRFMCVITLPHFGHVGCKMSTCDDMSAK
jgi:hypothetical protein